MVDKIWYNMEELIGGSEERGINRNILECKGQNTAKSQEFARVLIETYWNVKPDNPRNICRNRLCINRNILECKGRKCEKGSSVCKCINRNILECKVSQPGAKLLIYAVLIETYWNVKKILPSNPAAEPGINRNILECKAQ